jgi:hypothetical protein
VPSSASFASLAVTLGCSFEWLATGKGPRLADSRAGRAPEETAEAAVVFRHFARDDEEEQLIVAFRELDPFDRATVVALTETLSARPTRSVRRRLFA